MNFDQFLMKARYASNSILLLTLNKINCYFQSRLHLNVKLCSIANKSLPVTEDPMPGHQGGTVKRKQKRVLSQEVVNGHANASLTYKQKFNIKTIDHTQMFSIHSEIYSNQQQGCQSGSKYYRITNFVKFESRQCWINHYFRIRLKQQ